MFLGVFKANSMFLPSPGKKSVDAHEDKEILVSVLWEKRY